MPQLRQKLQVESGNDLIYFNGAPGPCAAVAALDETLPPLVAASELSQQKSLDFPSFWLRTLLCHLPHHAWQLCYSTL